MRSVFSQSRATGLLGSAMASATTTANLIQRRFFDGAKQPINQSHGLGPDSMSRQAQEAPFNEEAIERIGSGQYKEHKPRALMFVNRTPVEIIPHEENLLEVLEREDIRVPKFCYHQQLSVAGNCRMCMVQVDGTQNIIVACATAVMPGMSIITDSRLVRDAREGNCEMMLMNHPNDCPICEQATNCELQHIVGNYGSEFTRYKDEKHSINDFYMGPHIRITLTRCIHCTRCVRFLNEHTQDFTLGMIGRGGLSEISTFMDELEVTTEHTEGASQLCPVGNLNSQESEYFNQMMDQQIEAEEAEERVEAERMLTTQ